MINFNEFKNIVVSFIHERYDADSKDAFYKAFMNNTKEIDVFWNDVNVYYNDIQTRADAIAYLNIAITAINLNNPRNIQILKSYYNTAALEYTIFAKFFTKSDFKYHYRFWSRLYSQHASNNTRKHLILIKDSFNLILMLLESGM